METEGLTPELKKPDGRKTRAKSPPRPRERTRPDLSSILKALWADPEWRAKTEEKNRIAQRKKVERAKITGKRWTRYGVPDGMRKEQAQKLWKKANKSAQKTMTELKESGALEDLDPRSEEALEAAIAVMRSPSNQKTKLDAARLVLDFTKSKPVSKKELTLNKAEQWLKQIANDEDDEDEEPSNDTEAAA
jgi:exonuclease VII small subunit